MCAKGIVISSKIEQMIAISGVHIDCLGRPTSSMKFLLAFYSDERALYQLSYIQSLKQIH